MILITKHCFRIFILGHEITFKPEVSITHKGNMFSCFEGLTQFYIGSENCMPQPYVGFGLKFFFLWPFRHCQSQEIGCSFTFHKIR